MTVNGPLVESFALRATALEDLYVEGGPKSHGLLRKPASSSGLAGHFMLPQTTLVLLF